MNRQRMKATGEMIANPGRFFTHPAEVLEQPELRRTERLAILRTMELDATELSVATEENMPGPGDGSTASRLQDIRRTIRTLERGGAA